MSRITLANVVSSARKVRSMAPKDKEALADEIYLHQPHMLACCLTPAKLGVEPAAVDFLLDILLVCYQAMKESGFAWPLITEDEQERQMQRWIGAVEFSEYATGAMAAHAASEQYVHQHPERPLSAFVIDAINQWLGELTQRRAESESDKFVMMEAMTMVNCIAGVSAPSIDHE